MEENLITPQPDQPIQSIQTIPAVQSGQPTAPEIAPSASLLKIKGKTRNFLIGSLFSLFGAIVLALLDLLFIATVNPAHDTIVSFLVYLGPLLILGLYIFFLVYYFKRQRFIFWGLLVSLAIFIILVASVMRF